MEGGGGGGLKVSPAPAPIKILIVYKQENKVGEGLSIRGFVAWMSGGDEMPGSWVSRSGHDQCMDNKIYFESFIENILPTEYLYGRNQCQVQFY